VEHIRVTLKEMVRRDIRRACLGELADFLGETKSVIADAEKVEEKIKNEIKRRRPKREFMGDLFKVTLYTMDRLLLDADRVREKMGDNWFRKHSRHINSLAIKCSAKTMSKS